MNTSTPVTVCSACGGMLFPNVFHICKGNAHFHSEGKTPEQVEQEINQSYVAPTSDVRAVRTNTSITPATGGAVEEVRRQQSADARQTGSAGGKRSGVSRLKDAESLGKRMQRDRDRGMTAADIAAKHEVSEKTVYRNTKKGRAKSKSR